MRARLSRPLHRAGKSRQSSRSDHRSRHGTGRSGRSSFARLPPRSVAPSRSARGIGSRAPPSSAKRAAGSRGRRPRPPLPPPARARPLPPPARSYDRRPPGTTGLVFPCSVIFFYLNLVCVDVFDLIFETVFCSSSVSKC